MPEIAHRRDQPYVGVPGRADMADQASIAALADRLPGLIGALAAAGVPVAGAPFFRYHRFFADGTLDVEVGVPVPESVSGIGAYGVLPGGRFATLRHTGPFDGLRASTGELLDWMAAGGRAADRVEISGGEQWACRLELYLTNPADEPDPAAWQTDVAVLLKDAP